MPEVVADILNEVAARSGLVELPEPEHKPEDGVETRARSS